MTVIVTGSGSWRSEIHGSNGRPLRTGDFFFDFDRKRGGGISAYGRE